MPIKSIYARVTSFPPKFGLCFILLLFHGKHVWSQDGALPHHIQYTVEDGLPSNTVYCSVQDDRGFIWFGTDAGISRFDGLEFKNYSRNDGLPDNEILKLFKDSKGRIWMKTLNGKVGYIYQDEIFTSANTPELAKIDFQSIIRNVLEIQGLLIISSAKQSKVLDFSDLSLLSKYKSVKFLLIEGELYAENSLDHFYQIDLTSDSLIFNPLNMSLLQWDQRILKQDSLFLSYSNVLKEVRLHDSAGNIRYINTNGWNFGIYNIRKIQNQIFLFTEKGVFRWNNTNEFELHFPFQYTTNMLIDNQNNQWVTSLSQGVFLIPDIAIATVGEYNEVEALHTKGDSLWVGHDQSSVVLLDSNWTAKTYYQFLISTSINDIHTNPKGYPWILTDGGIVMNKKIVRVQGSTRSLIAQNNTALLTSSNGIFEIPYQDNVPTFIDPSGFERMSVTHANVDERFFHSNKLIRQGQDSLWVGGAMGLFLIHQDSVHDLSQQFSPLKSAINDLVLCPKGKLWAATDGNGIIIIDHHQFRQLTMVDNLTSNNCTALVSDGSVMWAGTRGGLNRIQMNAGNQPDIQQITISDGLSSNLVHDLEIFQHWLMIGTAKGLDYFNINHSFKEDRKLNVWITSIEGNLAQEFTDESFLFEAGTSLIRLNYRAIAFGQSDKVSYRYALKKDQDSEDQWVETHNRELTLTNLEPGPYLFSVQSKTKNSDWGAKDELAFVIHSFWWQTRWFQALLAPSLMSLIFLIISGVQRNRRIRTKLEKDRSEAQLKALKAQINPHFLFNALNSIQRFILKDQRWEAQDYLSRYSRLIRNVLDQSEKLLIPLKAEIDTLVLYVEMEQLRVENPFEFEVSVDSTIAIGNTYVPAMVLQPFVENAIWHGFVNRDSANRIDLSFNQINRNIVIQIKDNGNGFDTQKIDIENSTGIKLVRQKLKLIKTTTDIDTSLEIKSTVGMGTIITISISPKHAT